MLNLMTKTMTEKDKRLIEEARNVSYTEWYLVGDMMKEADTEEAKKILHSIESSKYHTEEYYAGCL